VRDSFDKRHPNHVSSASTTNIDMESCLTGFDKYVHDFYLFPMGQNVANHPTGQQAQMLSRVSSTLLTPAIAMCA
jgi:hypothetical protein